MAKPRIICVGSYDIKNDREAQDYISDEIRRLIKQKARDLNISTSGGFRFLKKKKQNKKLRETKILSDIEKNIRSKVLRMFEDLMGKRPALEVIIHLVD